MDWAAIDDDSNEYDGEDEDNSSEGGDNRLFKETDYYFNQLKVSSKQDSGSKEDISTCKLLSH
jgi:hypothetical protein